MAHEGRDAGQRPVPVPDGAAAGNERRPQRQPDREAVLHALSRPGQPERLLARGRNAGGTAQLP